MQPGLFSLDLTHYDAAKAPQPSADAAPDFILRIKKTRSGRDILVCSKHPAPPEAVKDAEKEGLALFTFHEVDLMRGCHPDLVAQIISVKIVMPGADVRQIVEKGQA